MSRKRQREDKVASSEAKMTERASPLTVLYERYDTMKQ